MCTNTYAKSLYGTESLLQHTAYVLNAAARRGKQLIEHLD